MELSSGVSATESQWRSFGLMEWLVALEPRAVAADAKSSLLPVGAVSLSGY
jgi:hypothetical protein